MQIGGYGSVNAGIPGLYGPGSSTQRPPVVTDGAAAGTQDTAGLQQASAAFGTLQSSGQGQGTPGLAEQSRNAGYTDANRGNRLNIVI